VLDVLVGNIIYSLEPGVPHDIPPEHFAAVVAAVRIASGTLAPVAAGPVITHQGAGGAASYTYEVVAYDATGDAVPSPTTTDAAGNAALGSGNGEIVTWVAPANPSSARLGFKVIRTAGGPSQGLLGTVGPSVVTFTDTGGAATVYTPAGTNPGVAQAIAGPPEI
jgi:hypothetical protein